MQGSDADEMEGGARPAGGIRFGLAFPSPQGAFWVALSLGGPRVAGAVATIVLRRLLGPGVAGLFDLAATPYNFLDGLRTVGTGPALVYEQHIDAETMDT